MMTSLDKFPFLSKLAILLFFFVSLNCCSTKEEVVVPGYPGPIAFKFLYKNQAGNNLFFGENNQYDPYSVKIGIGQDPQEIPPRMLSVPEGAEPERFMIHLERIYEPPREILINIQPFLGRVDTISIKLFSVKDPFSPFRSWHDISYNNVLICNDCNDFEVYTIVL